MTGVPTSKFDEQDRGNQRKKDSGWGEGGSWRQGWGWLTSWGQGGQTLGVEGALFGREGPGEWRRAFTVLWSIGGG
eukprot:747996-Hanusia_phi.AAC.1